MSEEQNNEISENQFEDHVIDENKMNSHKKRKKMPEADSEIDSIKATPKRPPKSIIDISSTDSVISGGSSDIMIVKNVLQNNTSENISEYNSIDVGKKLFDWLINPIKHELFLSKYWEKKILHIKRENPKYFSRLASKKKIDAILTKNTMQFTKNIEITSYENGIKKIQNPKGRALPQVVWEFYKKGFCITVLNAQAFLGQLYSLDSTLQEYFQCMIGTNLHLTPPNTLSISPHYDSNETFVLQIEGKNNWKVYAPRRKEKLPRNQSKNFQENEIREPLSEVVLEAGDILYIPRGFIYQATSLETDSLHVTLNVFQKNSWADLMEEIVPDALNRAIHNNEEFRQGLPLHIGDCMGIIYCKEPSEERTEVLKKVRSLFDKLFENAVIDDGIDRIFKKFQHNALPPDITEADRKRTIYGLPKDANKKCSSVIQLTTSLRLIRANCLRLVRETNSLVVYFSVNNSLDYENHEQGLIKINFCDAPILEFLITNYPQYTTIDDIPVRDEERKLKIVRDLWKTGLLMTKNPIDWPICVID